MCLKYLIPSTRFNEELRRMLQSGLIMKWKTVIIYLQTALLSSQLSLPAQMYWPAENECTASARGGISPTAIVTVSDMQVSAGYRVFREGSTGCCYKHCPGLLRAAGCGHPSLLRGVGSGAVLQQGDRGQQGGPRQHIRSLNIINLTNDDD